MNQFIAFIKKDKFPAFLITLITALSGLFTVTYNKLINEAPLIKYDESFRYLKTDSLSNTALYEYTFEIKNLFPKNLDSITLSFFYVTGDKGRIYEKPSYKILSKEFSKIRERYSDSIAYTLLIDKFSANSQINCSIVVSANEKPEESFFSYSTEYASPLLVESSFRTFISENEVLILLLGIICLLISIFILLYYLIDRNKKEKAGARSKMYKVNIVLFIICFKSGLLIGQVNYIKSVAIKNGNVNSLVRAKIYKKSATGEYYISSEYNPRIPSIDSCDCNKTPMVMAIPYEDIFFKSCEIPCKEIKSNIILECKKNLIGTKTIDFNKGFNGTRRGKTILTFEKDSFIDSLITQILKQASLNSIYDKNRIIVQAADVEVAEAAIIDEQRYIFYNPNIFNDSLKTNYADLGIFAHELAHHLLLHDFKKDSLTFSTRSTEELDADRWAGAIMAHLCDTLSQAIEMLKYSSFDTTEVSVNYDDRKRYFENGWNEQIEMKSNVVGNLLFNNNYYMGIEFYNDKTWAGSKVQFNAALKQNPKCADCIKYIGVSNFYLGQDKQAIENLISYNSTNPRDIETLTLIAQSYANLNENNQALKFIDKAIEINDHNTKALFVKAVLNYRFEKYSAALASVSKIIETDKENKDALSLYGKCLVNLNKFNESIAFYTPLIKQTQASDTIAMDYRLHRAICYIAKGNNDSAITDLQYSNLNDPETFYYLSKGYNAKDDNTRAKKYIAKAISINKGNILTYYHWSSYLNLKGNYKREAGEDLIKIKTINPNYKFSPEEEKLINKYSD